MSMGRPRNPRKEQQWQQRLRRWQRSQLSIAAFCRRQNLDVRHFYRWRHRLAARAGQPDGWLAVDVLTEPDAPEDHTLEVVLQGGRRLRVPQGFDQATLRQVLAVLEEPPPC